MDIVSFLRSNPVGKGVREIHLKRLAAAAEKKRYRSGRSILDESDICRTFHIVVRGLVKMFKLSPSGREQTLSIFGPGELFGVCAIFTDTVFPAHASALEEVVLLSFPGEVIGPIAEEDPAVLMNMTRVLSCRLKESMALVELLALKDIPQRVASFFLMSTAKKACRAGEVVELALTRRETAKIIGTTPETLSRVLKKMADERIIETERQKIRILDCEALRTICNSAGT